MQREESFSTQVNAASEERLIREAVLTETFPHLLGHPTPALQLLPTGLQRVSNAEGIARSKNMKRNGGFTGEYIRRDSSQQANSNTYKRDYSRNGWNP